MQEEDHRRKVIELFSLDQVVESPGLPQKNL